MRWKFILTIRGANSSIGEISFVVGYRIRVMLLRVLSFSSLFDVYFESTRSTFYPRDLLDGNITFLFIISTGNSVVVRS